MSFLKKVGLAILKGAQYAAGIVPIVQAQVTSAIPQSIDIFNRINGSIQEVEAIGAALQTPGLDKLKMAIPLVASDLLKYTNDLGHKVKDEALFKKASGEFAQACADYQNSLEG